MSDPVRDALLRGAELHDAGAHFAAHEAWELGWQRTADPTLRRVLQGLIQIAAGYHKLLVQRRPLPAARLLARGLQKLDAGPPTLEGLDLATYRDATRTCLAALERGALEPAAIPRLIPFPYQPYYCEENAYHLARHPALTGRDPAVIFIRAATECVLWHQRAARAAHEPVLWDYHVVVLARGPWEIWDLDSTLGCPVPALVYLLRSFRPELRLLPRHVPRLRVVPAAELAATFASDRSHMRTPDGSFTQPPPAWPPIGPPGVASSLERYLAYGDPIAGEELDLAGLLARVHDP